jgi:hypothetical protein
MNFKNPQTDSLVELYYVEPDPTLRAYIENNDDKRMGEDHDIEGLIKKASDHSYYWQDAFTKLIE